MGLFTKTPADRFATDLLGQLPLGISVYRLEDPDDATSFRLVYSNAASATLTGLQIEKEIGRRLVDIVPGIVETGFLERYMEVIRTKRPTDLGLVTYGDERIAERTYEVRASPLSDRALGIVFEDVTERGELQALRATRAELERGEARYRSLVEATAAIVWSTPPSGEFVDVPAQWERVTGQTPAEAHGWGWLDAVHPDDQEATASTWRQAVASQSSYHIEHRLRHADGQYRRMAARAVPIVGDDGQIQEWIGVHTDVEEQSQAAAELAASEARFRTLFDAIGDVVLVYPLTAEGPGPFLLVNEAALETYGYTREEMRSMTLADLLAPERIDVGSVLAELRKSRRVTFDSLHLTKGGRRLPMSTSARLVEYDGRLCVISLCRDDSERREFRRQLARANHTLERSVAERTAQIEAFAEDLKILHGITTSVHDTPEARYEAYLRAGCEMFDLPIGILSATPVDRETGERVYRIEAVVAPDAAIQVGLTMPLSDAFCDAVVARGETVAYADAAEEAPDHPACVGRGLRAFIGAPVTIDGEIAGTLNFVSHDPRPSGFAATELELIEVMADAVARRLTLDRVERAQSETKALYGSVLDAASDGIYGLDAEGRTTFVNPAAVALTGWSAAEQLGARQHDLIHHHRPDGESYPVETCPIYLTLHDGQARSSDDEVFWRKEGTALPVTYSVTPIMAGNVVRGAVVLFRERVPGLEEAVQAAQQSENLLRAVLAASPDGVMAFRAVRDASGDIVDFRWTLVNPRAETIVGHAVSDLLGQRLLDVFPGNREAGLFDAYVAVVETGQTYEQVVPYPLDGFATSFRIVASAIQDEDGLTVSFVDMVGAEGQEAPQDA